MATILLVDDDPVVRTFCERVLNIGGYGVLVASGGEDALMLLQNGSVKVELALLDVMMPGMNGIELASHILALNPRTQILLMTGYGPKEIARVANGNENPYRIMWKPLNMESLLRMIENTLSAADTASA